MELEVFIKTLNELIEYNKNTLIDSKAAGDVIMENYCIGKIQAYRVVVEALS